MTTPEPVKPQAGLPHYSDTYQTPNHPQQRALSDDYRQSGHVWK